MSDRRRLQLPLERASALRPDSIARAAISLEPLPAAARFALRLGAQAAAEIGAIGAFRLDMPVNTCSGAQGVCSARLGPDEWLLLAHEADGQHLEQELRAALAGQFHSVVDISHRQAALAVGGRCSREVLNGGCPLDLHDAAFPPGAAKRTLLGKAEVVLLRPGVERTYRLECWRSFAPYVHALLLEVAREF
jgi:sarcosine oxidase, subunit gamma